MPLSENITYLNPSDRKRFVFVFVLDDSNITNEEWNRIKDVLRELSKSE